MCHLVATKRWRDLSEAHAARYAPRICEILEAHIQYAPPIRCHPPPPGPTRVLGGAFQSYAPLISEAHIEEMRLA